jgi:ribosome-binding factor A
MENRRATGNNVWRRSSTKSCKLCYETKQPDPDLQAIVVVAVELSPDCGNARIAYAVQAAFAVEEQVKVASREALARGNGFLRARLASLLNLKRLPKLSFTFLGVRGGESWPG